MERYLYGEYSSAELGFAGGLVLRPVLDIISQHSPSTIIELGCGNGSFASLLSKHCKVVALDSSTSGIEIARKNFENIEFFEDSVYADLKSKYGTFDCVVSIEVIEHLYDPRKFIRNAYELLNDDGILVLSTPYHGYLKNLALALTGKLDAHFTALWDGGHIKFWSVETITKLLNENGLVVERVLRIGRVPPLAMTMVVVAKKC